MSPEQIIEVLRRLLKGIILNQAQADRMHEMVRSCTRRV